MANAEAEIVKAQRLVRLTPRLRRASPHAHTASLRCARTIPPAVVLRCNRNVRARLIYLCIRRGKKSWSANKSRSLCTRGLEALKPSQTLIHTMRCKSLYEAPGAIIAGPSGARRVHCKNLRTARREASGIRPPRKMGRKFGVQLRGHVFSAFILAEILLLIGSPGTISVMQALTISFLR